MSIESALSAIERGDLSELQHVLEESEWDIGSEPLDSKGQTALHIACANGHHDIVQYLVNRKGCSVTVEDVYGHTPLMLSFINKHWKVANFLLQIAPNSAINGLEGIFTRYNKLFMMKVVKESLVASCKEGYFELVKYLTDHIPYSKEALQIARSSGNLHIVHYLLKHYQCDIPYDMSDVHLACMMGDMDTVKTTLETDGFLFFIIDYFGTTPIHYATLERNVLSMIVQYAGEELLNITDRMGNTPLHHSIKYECIESVTILVEAPGCDVNLANLKGETPLIVACKYSNSAIVQVLVASERCDLNTADSEGNTALHIAVIRICMENIQCLLASDRCDPNVINKSGCTALHIACRHGVIPLLEALVADKRCDLNIQDGNGDTALHIGVENVEAVKCLLESGRSRCDIYDKKGLTPFHKAIANGVIASIEVILKNGVNILQTTSDEFQNAPIHIACKHSRLYILKVLLGYKNCDPNHQNAVGDTALHIVCRMRTGRELKFLEVLTSTPGINPTLVNHEGDAPIHTACMNSSLQSLVSLLTCESFDPNQQNTRGDTALHIVCRMRTGNALQILEWLMSTHGINYTLMNIEGITPCDVVGDDGNTLLHIACAKGTSTMVEFLVKNRADLLKPDRHGDAPIHIACKYSRWDILNVLLSCTNCNPNQQNAEGDTALHIVCRMRTGRELKFLEVLTSIPGINPTLVNHEGDSPIHTACTNSSLQSLVSLLTCESCDPNQQNTRGDTALHIVCRMRTGDELQFFELLTSTPGINPTLMNTEGIAPCDVVGDDGNTLLHIACAEGTSTMVEFLVKNRADQLKPDRHGDAPIHIACKYSRRDILNVLLSCTNCNPNQQNAEGDTALHIVCRMRTGDELQFFELLTSTPGINPTLMNTEGIAPCDVVGDDGNTLLHIACAEGTSTMVEFLVKNRADLLKPDRHGDAPIHIACKYYRLDILNALLSCTNCNPNQQNAEGDTALHIVCRMRSDSTLQFLEVLISRCDTNICDSEGNTALHIAVSRHSSGRLENVQCLLQSDRCDTNVINKSGHTPLHIVCHRGDILLLEALVADKRCDLNIQDGNGDTALHIGVENVEVVKCLLESGRSRCDIYNEEGLTPFHKAISNGVMASVEVMLKNGVNTLQTTNDKFQNAPIHIACICSRLDILKVLLDHAKCDPNQQNSKGDTALHIVCRMRHGSVLQFLEVLTSTPGINPTLVNQKCIGPFEEVDGNGNTLLHNACIEGDTRMAMFLLKNGVDVLKHNKHGDAPIHIACKYARLDLLKIFLNCTNCDPNQQNASGDTALHIVCKEVIHNEKQLLNTLISTVGIDPEIVNHQGRTPIEAAGISYSKITIIEKVLEHKRSSIQAYLKIFVVGNSGNGKSTLIKAVTTEASRLLKYIPLKKLKYVNPSDVPPHTAGIVPIPFNSKHFGNAVLYDFAGQHEYYSSHAAVMENLILPSPPLFLLLIDISKSKEVIREELVYWWHFINNQSQKAAAPPHVILAGSHKDMVKSKDREEVEIMIRDCIKSLPVTFEYVDYFPLNCRKLVSRGLSALLTQLNINCHTLRGIVNVNLHCHILNALLRAPEFQGLVYCKLVDIMNKIESDDTLLPKAFPQLISLLESLNDQGHILLLQNHTDESKSWVILKPDVLLTKVNGSVFAPKYFKEHCEFAMSTGVVTLSKLKEKFTEYSHEVIAAYLTHLEFCFRIKDQHTLDVITNNQVHGLATTEDYYFFPSLVRVENPTDVCQPHLSIDYECGWLYKCSKETEQLTTRFLHVLILRLAFACEPPDDSTETESVVLLRSCSVWKHGIAWWTNDGIEVIVEVGLQCHWVAVMMRCPATERVQCAELRSKVISTVLKTKKTFCPTITIKEYLIAPSSLKYPFEGRELTLYSMREVARATIEGKKYVKDTEGKNPITIPQLLPFEPYHNIGKLILKFFSGDTSAAIPPEELTQLAEKCHDKLEELNTAFKPDISSFQEECVKADTEVKRCVALFHILQRRGRFKTWRDFQEEFSRFSIFCKQSPLVRMIISMLNAHLNPEPVECRIIVN